MSLEYFNECMRKDVIPNEGKLSNHKVVYIKNLLEAQFSPRKFVYNEVLEHLQAVFPLENFN